MPGYISRECPQPRRTPLTGVNATVVNAPLLTLPATATAATAYVPPALTMAYAPPPMAPAYASEAAGYSQRTGYWRQTLDRCAAFADNAEAGRARVKEEKEKEKKTKEEQKERKKFERRIGEKIDSKFATMCGGGPVATVVGKTSCQSREDDDLSRLRRENEEYRKKSSKENELKMGRDVDHEILFGLKSEISLLRKEKQQSMEETQIWRNEALRPDNKRGTISLTTLECCDRERTRQRVVESPSKDLREEIKKMRDTEYCTLRGVEALKQKKADAKAKEIEVERRKREAKVEVTKLKEQVDKLTTEVVVVPTGGTNLKEKLEEVAASGQKTVRRGRPRLKSGRTPRRENWAEHANEHFVFLQEERRKLRALKKFGLEAICLQEGIKYIMIEATANALVEMTANTRFGKQGDATGGKGKEPLSSREVEKDGVEVEDVPSDFA
ncbi:hypothetical protein CBR_g18989 [Chara braunii]|uniref:Uncharacterized protein n=1 Tax=Chara braunii TaxID=69332 RepID=A0A388KWX6_CHABU|nr:hypothetical protein CBR_g18989 [Chara braunii]|eukprot:GBG74580.1 hypothetical protein CBR_g18989 [Chara braunii]